jgi:hypothetical protein
MTSPSHVIFCTASNRIIDYLRVNEPAEQQIARLTPEYGKKLEVLPAEEVMARYEASFKTPVVSISSEHYDYALNCLPPVAWIRRAGGETFKMSERMAGAVTAIYIANGDKYFRFYDDIRLPHEECLKRVADYLATATPGQMAYEIDVANTPTYPDGAPRVSWAQLGAVERSTWEDNPTPR